jgi:hypothetical protein
MQVPQPRPHLIAHLPSLSFFHPAPPTLPSLTFSLRFTNLIFVGYTAEGYKKGLCHETPTAEELAGATQRPRFLPVR